MSPRALRLLILGHVLFAGFFLPVAIMFAVTGGLYTFKITGAYETRHAEKALVLGAEPKVDELQRIAQEWLMEIQGLEPSGTPSVRKLGTSWAFDWPGVRREFTFEPTTREGVYKATYKEASWHRIFVQLHKAKGGLPFKVLAAMMAIGLIFLFASGVAMAYLQPRLRRVLYISLAFGTALFIGAIALS